MAWGTRTPFLGLHRKAVVCGERHPGCGPDPAQISLPFLAVDTPPPPPPQQGQLTPLCGASTSLSVRWTCSSLLLGDVCRRRRLSAQYSRMPTPTLSVTNMAALWGVKEENPEESGASHMGCGSHRRLQYSYRVGRAERGRCDGSS